MNKITKTYTNDCVILQTETVYFALSGTKSRTIVGFECKKDTYLNLGIDQRNFEKSFPICFLYLLTFTLNIFSHFKVSIVKARFLSLAMPNMF